MHNSVNLCDNINKEIEEEIVTVAFRMAILMSFIATSSLGLICNKHRAKISLKI